MVKWHINTGDPSEWPWCNNYWLFQDVKCVRQVPGIYLRISVMTCKSLNTNTVDFPTVSDGMVQEGFPWFWQQVSGGWCSTISPTLEHQMCQVCGIFLYDDIFQWCWLPTERLHSVYHLLPNQNPLTLGIAELQKNVLFHAPSVEQKTEWEM